MSNEESSASNPSSPESSASETQHGGSNSGSTKKKSSKASKPRLTAHQKNTNHKDAENKRRNAIRERFTELSHMVPETEGQERSEQLMLTKTAKFLKDMLTEQRKLEQVAVSQGVMLDDRERLKDNDYGGPKWRATNMDAYESTKVKKGGSTSGKNGDEDD